MNSFISQILCLTSTSTIVVTSAAAAPASLLPLPWLLLPPWPLLSSGQLRCAARPLLRPTPHDDRGSANGESQPTTDGVGLAIAEDRAGLNEGLVRATTIQNREATVDALGELGVKRRRLRIIKNEVVARMTSYSKTGVTRDGPRCLVGLLNPQFPLAHGAR